MSKDLRKQEDENPANLHRSTPGGRNRYEEFDGMNFEQRRPSYQPQVADNSGRTDENAEEIRQQIYYQR